MHLDTSFTGTMLREYRTTVSWRQTMNYAAAIDDPNEAYFNDEREGGIIAHPMNCAAITWPVSERIWEYIESRDFPLDLLATQVHFTEHLEFHRPLVPGDEITVKGRIAAIGPHRAGTHVIIRFDATDRDGKDVFTEHIGGLMRGVSCRGDAAGMENIPAVPKNPADETGWEAEIPISPLAPFVYDGCSNIYFPIHTSKKFARQVGLPGIILQGTATLALAVREIINRDAGGDPARLKKLFCRFTDMVLPGTKIRIVQTGKRAGENGSDIFFTVLNSEGRRAISGGWASVI